MGRITFCLICLFYIFVGHRAEAMVFYSEQIKKYFMDVVFENSFCKCQGNDGCTRGCRFVNHLDREQYPPFRRCEGKKPRRRSTDNCARHVTGAIMTVIHSFLFTHCNNTGTETSQNALNYKQCVDNFQEDVKHGNISICRHGFMFPSAFCLLNLDGKSFDLYNSISNRRIRGRCKNWNQYNQLLLNVDASVYYGEITIFPVFKKIPFEKITSMESGKLRVDPAKIPVGSIVISESEFNDPNGHIEVKTNKNECGENKDQICFCSDFCRERLIYKRPVLAVFEWNPEFIRYVLDTMFWWDFSL